MRSFGLALVVLGIAGFIYCTREMENAGLEPVPEGTSISRSLDYKSGRLEVGRYAAAAAGAFGVLLFFVPQGR
jgi:hypothetical protein